MTANTKRILNIMHVLTWIIYIGLCIETGAIIVVYLIGMFGNPAIAMDLHLGFDLSALKAFDVGHYSALLILLTISSALKATMFYWVIKIFMTINFAQPFSMSMSALIKKISYVALFVGVVGIFIKGYGNWLVKENVVIVNSPDYANGGGEFLFFAGIIYIISFVFQRGIEIQSENELTV